MSRSCTDWLFTSPFSSFCSPVPPIHHILFLFKKGISWRMKKFWDDWSADNWNKVCAVFVSQRPASDRRQATPLFLKPCAPSTPSPLFLPSCPGRRQDMLHVFQPGWYVSLQPGPVCYFGPSGLIILTSFARHFLLGHGGGAELACTAMNIVLMNFGFLGLYKWCSKTEGKRPHVIVDDWMSPSPLPHTVPRLPFLCSLWCD